MKKLLLTALVLTIAGASAVYADEPSTYTEYIIQKHTQKIVDKEKQLQQQQKAREEARLKRQEEFQQKMEAQKKAREEAKQQREEAFQKKIDEKLNPLKQKQAELEAQKKAREDAQKARQQKYEKKKQLLKELMSE